MIVCAAAALSMPAGSSAAVTIGSSLPSADNNSDCGGAGPGSLGQCFVFQTSLPVGRVLRAPFSGIVVRWRLRDAQGRYRLRAGRLVHPPGEELPTFRLLGATRRESGPSHGIATFPARLHLRRGDFVGLQFRVGSQRMGVRDRPLGAAAWDEFYGSGPLTRNDLTQTAGTQGGEELLYNADLEHDRDRDGFGDETQDLCPRLRAVHDRRC